MQTRLNATLARQTEERRGFRRFRLAQPALSGSSITIIDISRSGCQVQHEGDVRTGERITLDIPDIGRRMADVVWTVGRNAGCEFQMVLSESELDALVAGHRPASGFGRARR